MNSSAVSDAFRNADINGITNCKFVCSKVKIFVEFTNVRIISAFGNLILNRTQAEDVIESLLKEYIVNVQQPEIPGSDSVDTSDMKNPVTNGILDSFGNSNTIIVSEATKVGNATHVSETINTESSRQQEVSVVCDNRIINDSASPSVENHDKPSQDEKDMEENNTSMPRFKDVVAIVDPPRVGLHPKVSFYFFFFLHQIIMEL